MLHATGYGHERGMKTARQLRASLQALEHSDCVHTASNSPLGFADHFLLKSGFFLDHGMSARRPALRWPLLSSSVRAWNSTGQGCAGEMTLPTTMAMVPGSCESSPE